MTPDSRDLQRARDRERADHWLVYWGIDEKPLDSLAGLLAEVREEALYEAGVITRGAESVQGEGPVEGRVGSPGDTTAGRAGGSIPLGVAAALSASLPEPTSPEEERR